MEFVRQLMLWADQWAPDPVVVVIAGLFVAFYAMGRFNTPPTCRSSTTAFRYHTMQFCYVVVSLVIYSVLVQCPEIAKGLILGKSSGTADTKIVAGGQENAPQEAPDKVEPDAAGAARGPEKTPEAEPDKDKADGNGASKVPVDPSTLELYKELSSPFLAALLLTLFLPKVPALSDADKWLRERLHEYAGIPFEVLGLVARLQHCEWTVEQIADAGDLRDQLVEAGLRNEDIQFQKDPAPQFLWTKLSTVLVWLEGCRGERRAIGFLTANEGDVQRIQQRHVKLKKRAPDLFDTMQEHPEGQTTKRQEKLVRQMRTSFVDDCKDLLRDVYVIVARATLQCDSTEAARRQRLMRAGFQLPHDDTSVLTFHQAAAVFMAVFGVLFVSMVLVPATGEKSQADKALSGTFAKIVMIAIIYVVAVGWAVFPKRKWKSARPGPDGSRPWGFYIISTVGAVITAALVSYLFKCLPNLGPRDAWGEFEKKTPWLMMAASTALVLAFLADDEPRATTPGKLRLLEGLALGSISLAIAPCIWWRLSLLGEPPPLGGVLLACGLIGLILGASVPSWYRKAQAASVRLADERERLREQHP